MTDTKAYEVHFPTATEREPKSIEVKTAIAHTIHKRYESSSIFGPNKFRLTELLNLIDYYRNLTNVLQYCS